jgi:circadian clock protein KaiA
MADNQNRQAGSEKIFYSRLSIAIFPCTEQLDRILSELLNGDRYHLQKIERSDRFVEFVEERQEQIDCLIFLREPSLPSLLAQINRQGILLPAIFIDPDDPVKLDSSLDLSKSREDLAYLYHEAEVKLEWQEIAQLPDKIDVALAQFLSLSPACDLSEKPIKKKRFDRNQNQNFLMLQQRRLAEKLKERLGYFGIYYKRNPQDFYRNLSLENRQELIREISREYRQIILDYFSEHSDRINDDIDRFVNRAFFADISVPQVLEVHMSLMDEFAQQLKLEGRSEEILLDYRLALIDIIAHLCEMYRRSIPREDIPFELSLRMD